MYDVPEKLPTDPVLADLVPEFLEQWAKDLTVTFGEIKSAGNTEDLRRLGHTIKGSFLQFGFRDLSPVGRQIMEDAEHGDWATAESRVLDLLHVVRAMQERIQNGTLS